LHSGIDPFGSGQDVAVSLAQVGVVPIDALTLLFRARADQIVVTYSGQVLPLIQLAQTADYVVWGCDIAAYAGMTGELRFRAAPLTAPYTHNFAYLDAMQFSTEPIPEPGVAALRLIGLGVLVTALRGRRRC
jgi:hypothetical protein